MMDTRKTQSQPCISVLGTRNKVRDRSIDNTALHQFPYPMDELRPLQPVSAILPGAPDPKG